MKNSWYKFAKDSIEVDDQTLNKALDELVDHVYVDRTYDIPYLAGYSKDASVLYIDKTMPKTYKDGNGKSHDIDRFLIIHEAVEKSIIDTWKLDYKMAHQMALRIEEAAVKAAGLDWKEYDSFMQKWIKKADSKEIKKVPANLDLTPYEDEKDLSLIKKMKDSMS